MVSAFVAENQITLGQITVSEKSNEITAVPELLDMLDVKNSIVTADAMSCQKKITKKIYDKEADYVIGLKANQETFYDDVALYFQEFQSEMVKEKTFEKGHGRIEKREYSLLTDIGWLNLSDEWVNLNAVGMVKSTIIRNDEKHTYTRYFITSLTNLGDFAYAVRKHWSIENQLQVMF